MYSVHLVQLQFNMNVELKRWKQELINFQTLLSETLTQSRQKNVETAKIACDRSVDAVVCQLRALQNRVLLQRSDNNNNNSIVETSEVGKHTSSFGTSFGFTSRVVASTLPGSVPTTQGTTFNLTEVDCYCLFVCSSSTR